MRTTGEVWSDCERVGRSAEEGDKQGMLEDVVGR